MEKEKICPYHEQGETKEDYFLGNDILSCNYAKTNECPYKNSQNLSWEGEPSITICLSKGLVKKLETEEVSK